MSILVCPTCAKRFQSERSESLPFCSQRCRLIDLGRWLDEQYSLPVDPESESGSEDDETMPEEDDAS